MNASTPLLSMTVCSSAQAVRKRILAQKCLITYHEIYERLPPYGAWLDRRQYLSSDKQQPSYSSKEQNLIEPQNHYDGHSLTAHRRQMAQKKGNLNPSKKRRKQVIPLIMFSLTPSSRVLHIWLLLRISDLTQSQRSRKAHVSVMITKADPFLSARSSAPARNAMAAASFFYLLMLWSAVMKRFLPESYVSATVTTRRTGYNSYAQTRTFQKKRSSAYMANRDVLQNVQVMSESGEQMPQSLI